MGFACNEDWWSTDRDEYFPFLSTRNQIINISPMNLFCQAVYRLFRLRAGNRGAACISGFATQTGLPFDSVIITQFFSDDG